jgi:signal transduction histidine kinase
MLLKDAPIQRKLMAVILLTSAVVLLLTCTAFIAYEVLTFRNATVRQLAILGQVIASNSTAALAFDNSADATEILAALKAERYIVAAGLYDANGRLFSTYPADLAVTAFPAAPRGQGHRFAPKHLDVFQPVVQGEKRLGTLYLKFDIAAMYQRFRLYGGIVLLVIAGSFLVAYLLSQALQRQISGPILALAETAKAVSDRRDYSVRAARYGKDELGLLTAAFNQMLTQIQEQHQALRASEASLRELSQELEQRVIDRTEQLEAVNRELESFCYSVSHDLRAPLRAIDGFSMILMKSFGDNLGAEAHHYLGRVREGSQHMGRLIDDLLKLSRTTRSELKMTTVNLSELASLVANDLTESEPERRVTFRIAPGLVVRADATLMRVMLENLLGNAWKFSRKRLDPLIEVGAATDADRIAYFVRDNGAGFDMKYVDKLFGPFQRLHSVSEFEGTGVGLANVQRIIVRHGGRVWAESIVDHGATFYFTLPT